MFIAVRKYRVRRGSSAEWAERVRAGFVPLIRELAGFRGYYLLQGEPNELIAISVFDSADQALVSNDRAADWARNNVMEFARGLPDVMVGDVLVAEVRLAAPPGDPSVSSMADKDGTANEPISSG